MPFAIYINDLPDHLSADSIPYTGEVKLIAPRTRPDILQSSLHVSASWSKDWELSLNHDKSEHLLIGNPPHFVNSTLPAHSPPNTQTIPKVSNTKNLGIVLNTRLGTEDNVVSVANKTRRMLLYLTRSLVALTPSIFLSVFTYFFPAHLEFKHPISPCDAEALRKV